MHVPRCVDAAKAGCGEGALWDVTRGCLWWVDISGEALHCYEPATGRARRIALPWLISALALDQNDGLLIATARGLGRVDPARCERNPNVRDQRSQSIIIQINNKNPTFSEI